MICSCAILFLDNKKYIVKCPDCKKISDTIFEDNNNNKYKFRLYEKHIEILRDNPHLRMGIELLLLVGWTLALGLCWMEWFGITSSLGNPIHKIIGLIFAGWVIVLICYLDAVQKLINNSKYFLRHKAILET